jgi:hypothetical protein
MTCLRVLAQPTIKTPSRAALMKINAPFAPTYYNEKL